MVYFEFLVLWGFFIWLLCYVAPRTFRAIRNHHDQNEVQTIAYNRERLYTSIARLEIELFGHTYDNEGSQYEAGITNLYGIDATGHYDGGKHNVNASIGPVCKYDGTEVSSPLPSFPGDPLWTDEDGRPW